MSRTYREIFNWRWYGRRAGRDTKSGKRSAPWFFRNWLNRRLRMQDKEAFIRARQHGDEDIELSRRVKTALWNWF